MGLVFVIHKKVCCLDNYIHCSWISMSYLTLVHISFLRRVVPSAVFSQPPIGTVDLTEEQVTVVLQ
uniref:Uncharacterized protein n=1 Tax=Rhizophora mucronata TaxID=61149 RepID=A0A2P2LI47_RHIMU